MEAGWRTGVRVGREGQTDKTILLAECLSIRHFSMGQCVLFWFSERADGKNEM